MKRLKRIRIVVAILFFLAITLIFVDINNVVPAGVCLFFGSTQIIPSFMRTLTVLSAASLGFFLVSILTILFGRFYCSTLCPLGILQDIVIRVAKRIDRRRRFKYKKQHYILHYLLFVVTTILAFSGSVILLNLFEPYSNYGRIVTNLLSPLVVAANNAISYLLGAFGYMLIHEIPILNINFITVFASFCILVLVTYLSYKHGRLFCNLLCPAGAYLGLLSRFSFYRIVIDGGNCKECGLCDRVCKAGCINSSSKEIDFAACIGCFNCIDSCPTNGISYQRRWKRNTSESSKADTGRREVLKSSVLPALGLLLPVIGDGKSEDESKNGYIENRKYPISPPGSLNIERFSSLCTACHLCISNCPTQVLFPSFLEYGITGVFQPRMNYDIGYCNYDCSHCSNICPTGALLPLGSSKKEVQIGQVQFNKEDCIVVKNNTDCGACSEHCPTKAVYMVPYGEYLMIPETNIDICVGCGACEYVCPAEPNKAIYVKSNKVHQKALKPKTKKAEQIFDNSQEFPF